MPKKASKFIKGDNMKKETVKVFLGGTCNESTWRDELIKKLAVNFFNPVVDDWTEECKQIELDERENCTFCLYVLTPEMTGVYSIAEVIDDANKRPDKTIFAIIEGDTKFDLKLAHSLDAVKQMVIRNEGNVFETLDEIAEFLNNYDPEEEKRKALNTIHGYNLVRSPSDKFVKEKDLIVLKGHIFNIQSISPKKIILKLYRKFRQGEKFVEGTFCYIKDGKFVKFKQVKKEYLDKLKTPKKV